MFDKILGQQKIKNILSGQIKSAKIAHAYIFMGQAGVGKRLAATEFAKILNCSVNDYFQTDAGACGKCRNCEKISKNIHPDVHFIDFAKQAQLQAEDVEKQKTLKIGTIRYMQKEVSTKIREGRWKFFIVEPAEQMNSEAANSLLKTLEEPPENTIIILIAKHKETIPQTIVSRSQTLFFQPLDSRQITNYLMLNRMIAADKAVKIAAAAEGSIETAEKFIDEAESQGTTLWFKLKNEKLCASDILDISKEIAKDEPLGYIDAMTAQAKKEFRMCPHETMPALLLLRRSRELLLKNVNAQTVFDNLLFDLYELGKTRNIL
ncbi:MAG: DNA polymerase III subunit delta' [Endomicrobium sp.]|jgi:DNA polymerase-3 subunit delta'|nr:DNA polymerase III subunit delta' [Endomicrobium sp.]